jgi:hypothetical protein
MDIEVSRSDFTNWRIVDLPSAPLEDGQARLRIDRFGFSSNNVSYAVIGDMLRYWDFFPAAEAGAGGETQWGRVPAWGFADVVETRSADLAVGERLFGFLPMSTELVIDVGQADATRVVDVAPHRSEMAGAYNGYMRCAGDPVYRPDREEVQMLLYPLFFTSFVISDFLEDNDDFGAEQVVITSASAKTALGAASLIHARGLRTVGVTSPGNLEFCRSLGVYDDLVVYDDVATLDQVPSVLVDVSGNQDVVSAVHRRLEGTLAHSMIVGDTHWDHQATSASGDRPGPAPAFLFAPSQIAKRSKDWGPERLAEVMAVAWSDYSSWAASWLVLDPHAGPEAIIEVFRTYLAGRVDPTVGTVCTMFTAQS